MNKGGQKGHTMKRTHRSTRSGGTRTTGSGSGSGSGTTGSGTGGSGTGSGTTPPQK
jgi:hypothetical protein